MCAVSYTHLDVYKRQHKALRPRRHTRGLRQACVVDQRRIRQIVGPELRHAHLRQQMKEAPAVIQMQMGQHQKVKVADPLQMCIRDRDGAARICAQRDG